MQRTTNYNLKKPERVEASLIDDINDNMDTIDAAVHDTKDSVVAFTSSDVADGGASSWTNVTKVASGEKHSSLFAKMSQMFKNIRYLYKLLGTTDISSIGDGTVTGVLSSLNDSFANYILKKDITGTTSQNGNIALGISAVYYTVVSIRVDSTNPGIALAWNATNSNWYAKILDTNTGASKANYAVTLMVEYKAVASRS